MHKHVHIYTERERDIYIDIDIRFICNLFHHAFLSEERDRPSWVSAAKVTESIGLTGLRGKHGLD